MKDAGTDLSDQEEKTRRRLSGEEFFQTSQSPSQWPLAENPAAGRRSVRDPKSFAASRGAHPQGRVADRATRRAERRCAAFSDSVDELVAGLRVDIDGSTAAWRVWQWEQARDCGRDRICAARVCTQLLSTDISDQTWLRHSKRSPSPELISIQRGSAWGPGRSAGGCGAGATRRNRSARSVAPSIVASS